ncbi:MAG: ABC transporter ATP-binding protein [Phycisphaerales bacterium]|nr:ABC transporter ATP-binding protein [Phycisphaerales bacterium]
MTAVIDLRHVSKTYGRRVRALRGISMHVEKGEIFGLLGPNGAGKSTLVKILMTVISPSRAEGTMLGARIGDKGTLAKVGYLPEHHRFPEYLTGRQVIEFYGAMAMVRRRERKAKAAGLLDLVGMTDWADTRVKGYSKGMRQRIGIAQALVNSPELIVLDEPTDGVDPVGRRDIRMILTRLKQEGCTVFLNSHLLSELEMVCDRVAILVQGQVSSQGTIEELTRDQQRYEIEIALPEGSAIDPGLLLPAGTARALEAPAAAGITAAPQGAAGNGLAVFRGTLTSGESVIADAELIRVGARDPGPIQPILDGLRSRGITIKAVRAVRPSLEDLFMQAVIDPVTGKALAPGAEHSPKKSKKEGG